jgi:hypothetical protein
MQRPVVVVFATVLFLVCAESQAHQPTMSDGTAVDADHAIEFVDVQISRVVYHEITEQAPRLWITFEVDEAQELRLQLGLPFIDRLSEYRPALVLLGPELPEVELPFEFPEGLGGLIFNTDDISDPEVFYEPFSGTTSWILLEQDAQLPAAGRYYVVAYEPSGTPGKLWVALGIEEVFGLGDILSLPAVLGQVRSFHEVPGCGTGPCFLFPTAAGLIMFRLVGPRRKRPPLRTPLRT